MHFAVVSSRGEGGRQCRGACLRDFTLEDAEISLDRRGGDIRLHAVAALEAVGEHALGREASAHAGGHIATVRVMRLGLQLQRRSAQVAVRARETTVDAAKHLLGRAHSAGLGALALALLRGAGISPELGREHVLEGGNDAGVMVEPLAKGLEAEGVFIGAEAGVEGMVDDTLDSVLLHIAVGHGGSVDFMHDVDGAKVGIMELLHERIDTGLLFGVHGVIRHDDVFAGAGVGVGVSDTTELTLGHEVKMLEMRFHKVGVDKRVEHEGELLLGDTARSVEIVHFKEHADALITSTLDVCCETFNELGVVNSTIMTSIKDGKETLTKKTR